MCGLPIQTSAISQNVRQTDSMRPTLEGSYNRKRNMLLFDGEMSMTFQCHRRKPKTGCVLCCVLFAILFHFTEVPERERERRLRNRFELMDHAWSVLLVFVSALKFGPYFCGFEEFDWVIGCAQQPEFLGWENDERKPYRLWTHYRNSILKFFLKVYMLQNTCGVSSESQTIWRINSVFILIWEYMSVIQTLCVYRGNKDTHIHRQRGTWAQ